MNPTKPARPSREDLPPSARGRPTALVGAVLLVGLTFGLLTGFGELLLLGVRKYVQHEFLFTGADVIWSAPLVTGLVFGLVAVPIALFAFLLPRLVTPARTAGFFVFLGAFSWFYLYPQFHRVAALVLAMGIGVQAARLLVTRQPALVRFSRWGAPVLLLLVALLGAGLHLGRGWLERRSLAGLGDAREGTPNVLLIVLDTVRDLDLSLYGYERPTTPALERFAARGFRFDRAFSTAPWTLPSHASMFTGRAVHEMAADWLVPLGGTWPTLAEALQAEGYVTAGFVANTNYTSAETGLARGFIHYEDYVPSPALLARNAALVRVFARNRAFRRVIGDQDAIGRRSADDISGAFLGWLDHAPPDRPFFAFLNFYDAHRPYLPPEPFASRFIPEGTEPDPRLARNAKPGDADRIEKTDWARNAYDGALAYLDDRLGRLLDSLAHRGLLDHTIVIVTSDHGEEFGEHGLFDHGNSVYRQATQVPLVIVAPRVPAGGTAAAPVSLRDLPRTILDLALGRVDSTFPGRSLARFWTGSDTMPDDPVLSEVRKVIRQPEWYPASQGDLAAVISGRYRYIRNLGSGTEELYDIETDPLEARDLADSAAGQAVLPGLRAVLAAARHAPAITAAGQHSDTVRGEPR